MPPNPEKPKQTTVIGRCNIPSILALKALSLSGFDAVLLDRQHGLIDERSMFELLAFAREGETPVYLRPLSADAEQIGQALDAGAQGLFVPMVNSPEEAEAVVEATRYPPRGSRSWGPIWPQKAPHVRSDSVARSQATIVAMVETIPGLDAIESIVGIDGIDCVYLGLNDLALSVGIESHPLDDAEFRERVAEAMRAVVASGKRAGLHVESGEDFRYWSEQGCSVFVVGSDVSFLMRGARDVLDGLGSHDRP